MISEHTAYSFLPLPHKIVNSNYSPNVMFRWTPMYNGEEVAVYVLVMNQALID